MCGADRTGRSRCYSSRRSERLPAALIDGYGAAHAEVRQAIDIYCLVRWLELWCWLASFGDTARLDEIAREMRVLAS